jgi:hypothetical protein
MNSKTAKIIRRYQQLKGSNLKDLKREWYSLSKSGKDLKRQEYLAALAKK